MDANHQLDPNWRTGFPSTALTRGAGYARNGLVGVVRSVGAGWEATVDGSEPYHVFVPDVSHGSVADGARCTCPWFAKGHLCKHIAAVCIALEQERVALDAAEDGTPNNGASTANVGSNHTPTIPELLARASDEEVRSFLADLLAHDDQLAYRFRMRVGAPDANAAKRALSHELSQIVRVHAHRGFIDYRAAYDFERDYLDAVEDALAPFELRADAEALFSLTDTVLTSLRRVRIDDSDGFFMTALSVLRTYWDAAFDALPNAKAMTAYVKKLLAQAEGIQAAEQEADIDWFLVDQIEEYVVERFADSPDQAGLVLGLADARIAACRRAFERRQKEERDRAARAAQAGRAWGAVPMYDIHTPRWVAVRLRAMRASGASTDEVLAYADPYLQSQTVAEAAADLLDEAGETERAVRLYECLLAREGVEKHVRRFLLQRLKDWCAVLGENESLVAALRTLLVEADGYEGSGVVAALWNELKATVVSADWPQVSNNVLAHMQSAAARCDCLAAEGRIDELAAALEGGDCGYRTPASYEDQLLGEHADVLVRWYATCAEDNMAGHVSGRKAYRKSIEILAHLADLPGGAEEANRIAAPWREKYSRRPALLEELAAAGF